jgi:hypothetical protein
MTQLAPTTLIQSQAVSLIRDLQNKYLSKEFKSPDDVARELKSALTTFLNGLGQPLFEFDPFVEGEPVLAEKMNRMFKQMQDDINILTEQTDYARAGAIFLFNYVNTEILKAQRQNAQASNKLKTLQLYSSAQDNDVIIFGDYFLNEDQVDNAKTPVDTKAIIQYPGFLTLSKATSDAEKILSKAKVTILDSSNGFLGNNQEIDPRSFNSAAAYYDDKEAQQDLTFLGQDDRHARLDSTIDQDPTTWIEYEYYMVDPEDRIKAEGFNFTYRKPDPADPSKEVQVDWATGPGFSLEQSVKLGAPGGKKPVFKEFGGQPVDIASNPGPKALLTLFGGNYRYIPGNDAGVLKLDFQVELQELRKINTITLVPYALTDNKNYPILVEKVETSEDGSTWIQLNPTNMWIANEKNLETARIADNSVVGSGVWVFSERTVKYIRFQIRQKYPVDCVVGHVYWETKKRIQRKFRGDNVNVEIGLGGGSGGGGITEIEVGGERKEGPIPTVVNPAQYNDPRYSSNGDLVKKVEAFQGKRWAIGVRDVTIDEVLYKPVGVIVSKPFKINGIVDRVSLEADIDIPSSFPTSDGQLWVKFFVSPDDGINWFPISRIQDDFLGIPEIVAFNDPLPEEFHETGVGYYNVNSTVNSVRLKIELSRPASTTTDANTASTGSDLNASSTPVVKWYKLKVRKR